MKKSFPVYPLLAILAVVSLCLYIWLSTKPDSHSKGGKSNEALVVQTIHPVIKSVPLSLEEMGTVEAAQTVNVVSQVNGTLKKIAFEEGKHVEQGQLLFELDSASYVASLDQAKANAQRDRAQLVALKGAADRYLALAKLEYVTRQQADDAVAAADAQQAVVAADEALVKQAEIQFNYTQIRAPISGKSSHISVHVGDLITTNSATPLVVINSLDPVFISFSIAQDNLNEVQRYRHQGTLMVEILAENSDTVLANGELVSINNNVNNQTGTIEFKAKVQNAKHVLWPGQLLTVRLILTVEPNVMVVPDSVVQMGQKGSYVYLIREGKAVIQPITVVRKWRNEAVVSGVGVEDNVISEVPPALKEGREVKSPPLKKGG